MKGIITLKQALNDKNFRKKFNVITINNDKPITITKKDYNVIEGIPQYTDSEKVGRSDVAIAVISPNTLAVYTSKNIEYPYPINWSKTIKNMGIYNRSHIIGYRLSAKKIDYNNIFIGTAYMNQITMKSVENALYNKIKENNRIYLYKVTPMYKMSKDTVPLGILMEAESIDNLEKDYMCKFCYNIQKGVKIDYYDGSNKPIEKVYNTLETQKLKKDTDKNEEGNRYRNYSIDVRTKTFHVYSANCNLLQGVESKYIQETRACEDEIIKKSYEKDYKLCKKCNK